MKKKKKGVIACGNEMTTKGECDRVRDSKGGKE